jgi:hypothetical protein
MWYSPYPMYCSQHFTRIIPFILTTTQEEVIINYVHITNGKTETLAG